MGEYADMMLDGTMCSSCGEFLGTDNGYPTECRSCADETRKRNKQAQKQANIERNARQKKTRCPHCNKKVKEVGLQQHIDAVHNQGTDNANN